MNLRGFLGTAVCLVAGLSLVVAAAPASAGPRPAPGVQLENLDRGLVAASTSAGDFLSWRLLGQEVTGAGRKGMTGPDFVVFRDGKALTTVTDSTNYLDPAGTPTSVYQVAPTGKGPKKKGPKKDINAYAKVISRGVTPWADGHYDLPLMKPAPGVTPAGEAYTYSANDMSVGDADGDGSFEFTVKWDPSNSKDVSQIGYTGPVFVDTYKADGTLLYRLDLGVNIRAGAHYTEFLVYDFDGDGRSEMMVKTAPGSKVLTYDAAGKVKSEKYVTMPASDVAAGYSNADDYRLSKAGYYQHVVKMFMTWQDQPEVVAGHWPATLEQAFGQLPTHTYPLSRADAEELADYFMDVYAPSRSARNVLRNFEGFIVDGPEYLTVFNGATGAELQTIHYEPGRHDDGLMWGDYAMARIEPANRVDRFLAAVAYLDGKRPSAVFARGYYTRTNLVSYNWDGKRLSKVWKVDSGWTPMSNPFNDSPHGVDGTDPPVREDHDPGVPFPECGRRGRRRKARDCLRLRHDQRGRVGPVQPFDTLPSAPLTE